MADDEGFRFDGGATWVNLLATRGQSFGARPIERIPTEEAARRWLTLAGFPPRDALTGGDLEQLVLLREALRDLAMAAVAGREPSSDARAHVQRIASASLGDAFANPSEDGTTVAEACTAIAVQALVTMRGPDRHLLKECGEVDCRWVFLDTSGRRHWCPSPACATRGRVRAHRARNRTSPG